LYWPTTADWGAAMLVAAGNDIRRVPMRVTGFGLIAY
jgi:hypothetical protein